MPLEALIPAPNLLKRLAWPALLSVAVLLAAVAPAGLGGADPVRAVDDPLPDLPAVTLTRERLDTR